MSIDNLNKTKYAEGFDTTVEAESLPPGLDEDTVRKISAIKEEPEWLLDFRLKAFKKWVSMAEPDWSELQYVPIDYQALSYYSAPKYRNKEDIPQEILDTFEKLGVPLHERDALLGIETEQNKNPELDEIQSQSNSSSISSQESTSNINYGDPK